MEILLLETSCYSLVQLEEKEIITACPFPTAKLRLKVYSY